MRNNKINLDELREFADFLARDESVDESGVERVILSEEVKRYAQDGLAIVQEKLRNDEELFETDFEFIKNVKIWMSLSENERQEIPDIEKLLAVREEALKRMKVLAKYCSTSNDVDKVMREEMELKGVSVHLYGIFVIKKEEELEIDLPERLIIYDFLEIENIKSVTIPKVLFVKDGARLSMQWTKARGAFSCLEVNGDASFFDIDFGQEASVFPSNLKVKGFLDLAFCKIKRLLGNVKIEGGLGLNGAFVEETPESIECRDLHLESLGKDEVPKRMIVHGDISCTDDQEKLVHDLIEKGVIVLDGEVKVNTWE